VRACVAHSAACCPGRPPADPQQPSALPLRLQRALSGCARPREYNGEVQLAEGIRVSHLAQVRPTPQAPHACSPRARPPERPTAPSQSCCVAVWHAGCRRPMRGHAAPGPHSYATMTQRSARAWMGKFDSLCGCMWGATGAAAVRRADRGREHPAGARGHAGAAEGV